MNKKRDHHIWCNYFMYPRKGCKMCEELYGDYPMDNLTGDELMSKHFPDNIKVSEKET